MGKKIVGKILFHSEGSGDALCNKWMLADRGMRQDYPGV